MKVVNNIGSTVKHVPVTANSRDVSVQSHPDREKMSDGNRKQTWGGI